MLHKLSETDAEMNINEKFERTAALAKKVTGISKMKDEADKANEKLERVIQKWNSIQGFIESYKKALNKALMVHQLNRYVQ